MTATPGGSDGGSIYVRHIASSPSLGGQPAVEVEARSGRAFPVRNEIAVLQIGGLEVLLSRYPDSGDTHVLIFTLTEREFREIPDGALVFVQYGRGEQTDRWELGRFHRPAS